MVRFSTKMSDISVVVETKWEWVSKGYLDHLCDSAAVVTAPASTVVWLLLA